MRLSKGFNILIAVVMAFILFTGGMNTRYLKDLVVVEGVGIDKSTDGINLTVQTLNVGINNGAQIPQGNMTINSEQKAKTIPNAVSKMSKSLSKRMFFGQNKIIAIGKELAEADFSSHIDYIMRSSDTRADVAVCLSANDAKTIIDSKENDTTVPCENILYLINSNEKAGLSCYVKTNDLINMYADKTTDIYMPVLERKKDEKSVSSKGIALFNGDRLAHITNDDETMGFVIMNGKPENVVLEAKSEKFGNIGVKLSDIKCKKSTAVVDGKIVFSVSVKADMIIDEIEKASVTTLKKDDIDKICRLVEKRIVGVCKKAFLACVSNSSDSLRVGEYLARDCPKAYELASNNWDMYFQSVHFSPDAKINIKKISDNTQLE